MKLLTRDTDYAVRALLAMAARKSMVAVSDLVIELKIPRPFLRRILQRLTKADVLGSLKGKGGGFVLKREPAKISLVDLMAIFQGPVQLSECLFKKKICPNRKTCPLRSEISEIEDFALTKLRSITIAKLLRK
ncbi:MAG TPA: Rrf2 family transcriptional regulator [Candidatus Omnitrophota bacterium]|nr:Rrf2 family transcriptional regulator [Candidatus Omnitrophota bacterium]HRZ14181.1 Rrf2 family transcriptional regulator [Candidatus Omnitrophota bacterium]